MPALLIGAPTGGLEGIDVDLDMVAARAPAWGFGPPVVERSATLAVVRRRLAELLGRTDPGDRVLLYLTGHGGFIDNRGHDYQAARPAAQRLHYFVTTPDPAAGEQVLFDAELSLWCARLAQKTANIAVVVDSCHAAGLVRADRARALVDNFHEWRAAHQDELDALHPEAHPDIVRLSAAGVHGVAQASATGSALTHAWLAALAEPGALGSSWLGLFTRIELRLARAGVFQQPRLSGPVRRRIFDLETTLPPGAFPVRLDGSRLVLAGGADHGVLRGDLFMLRDEHHEQLVQVEAVAPGDATLQRRDPAHEPIRLTPASFAVPLHLRGHDEAASHRSRSAVAPLPLRLSRLQSLGGLSLASLDLRVTWGRVRRGVCEPLSGADIELDPRTSIYVRIENGGEHRRFVSVCWISADGDAALLSRSEAMGVEISGRSTYVLGDRPFSRAPRGLELPRRPLAAGERRREQLVIVASRDRQALWALDTVGTSGSSRRSAELTGTQVLPYTVVADPEIDNP